MNNIINKNSRRGYNNPYRHGVLIGNFVEDIVGQDLKEKQESESVDKKNYVSEMVDKYSWPQLKSSNVKDSGNDLTMKCNLNLDLNIDFTTKNAEDYLKLQAANEYELDDKNTFLSGQIKAESSAKRLEEITTGFVQPRSMYSETQNMLKEFHQKDSNGHLFTKKTGIVTNLFFGHGLDQRNFTKNEYASTYHLTVNKKERTDKIYNSKYKVAEPFMIPPKELYDKSDWDYRRFKKYDEFTKTFDQNTNLER